MSSSWSLAFQTRGYPTRTDSKLYNAAPNTNTSLTKVCKSCNNGKKVSYVPLKTTRYNANLSQKLKQAAFLRRSAQHAIPNYDTINLVYRNL